MQAILLGALFAWWALPTAIKVCYAIFKYIEPPSSDPPKRQAPEPEPEPTPESPPQPPQPRDYMPIIFDQLNDPARRAIDKKDGSIYLKVDLSLLTEGEKCAAWGAFRGSWVPSPRSARRSNPRTQTHPQVLLQTHRPNIPKNTRHPNPARIE